MNLPRVLLITLLDNVVDKSVDFYVARRSEIENHLSPAYLGNFHHGNMVVFFFTSTRFASKLKIVQTAG